MPRKAKGKAKRKRSAASMSSTDVSTSSSSKRSGATKKKIKGKAKRRKRAKSPSPEPELNLPGNGTWTADEEKQLCDFMASLPGKGFKKVAKSVDAAVAAGVCPGRGNGPITLKWRRLRGRLQINSSDSSSIPEHSKRGRWTEEEDDALVYMRYLVREKHGGWTFKNAHKEGIGRALPGRTFTAMRERAKHLFGYGMSRGSIKAEKGAEIRATVDTELNTTRRQFCDAITPTIRATAGGSEWPDAITDELVSYLWELNY